MIVIIYVSTLVGEFIYMYQKGGVCFMEQKTVITTLELGSFILSVRWKKSKESIDQIVK